MYCIVPVRFMGFLSTPSGWRATYPFNKFLAVFIISIHALRVEGDFHDDCSHRGSRISIHALRVEGDGSVMFSGSR